MKNKIIKYQLISASGNPTAIVNGQYDDDTKRYISQQVFLSNKSVEQIAYIYCSNKRYSMDMMGNEFSANGCRSACFYFLKGRSGKIDLITSGTTKIVKCSIDDCGNSTVTIPYQFNQQRIIKNDLGFLIKMFGSNLLVIKGNGNLDQAQQIIKSQFSKTNATGIMFFKQIIDGYQINPFFWVKETNTLVNETACGSGSVALAIYLSYLNKQSYKDLKITQPSKLPIFVTADYKNKVINNISISGPTELLGSYNVKI